MFSESCPELNEEYLVSKLIEFFKDTKATIVKTLSILETCLLIAMAKLSTKYANQPFNLEMVLHEYKEVRAAVGPPRGCSGVSRGLQWGLQGAAVG